jgi:hypothetical protein
MDWEVMGFNPSTGLHVCYYSTVRWLWFWAFHGPELEAALVDSQLALQASWAQASVGPSLVGHPPPRTLGPVLRVVTQ